ncbi:MAG: LOG family protein [Oscillatoria sp. PMC 1051.18]|nr:LOG family protein [Oscillatoria sp. PMC 1050.18]MEC5029064.1 LOG family protein [Oscillatoria sp. PMC 1051.18]
MPLSPSEHSFDSVSTELVKLIEQLPNVKHGKLIQRALAVLVRIASEEIDRLDWKILTASLEDLERGFAIFYPYRHVRKVTIFGSARIGDRTPEYRMAVDFARYLSKRGYMVMTGAGGGIMQAGNEGAGREHSFGLNIQLPFEQGANAFIEGDEKLINFKYFFTRKLFFLRESDAIALFPGGYGTQDEAFECLTLCQTGRYGPVPLVLIDKPGGDYWTSWHDYVCQHLVKRGLVSPEDPSIYTITDDVEIACAAIDKFYRVYHSSRYVGELFVMRLNHELLNAQVEELNDKFSDILTKGKIAKSEALPEEAGDETVDLPRIVFYFNQRDLGRLYQMITLINQWEIHCEAEEHPERK